MSAHADSVLQTAIEGLAVPGIMVGHRLISPRDEYALLPEEIVSSSCAKIRRASGAARIAARELLAGATPSERSALATYVYGGRLLFAAKEAVYKAVADLDQKFLNHRNVEVDFHKRRAVVRNGRTVELRFCISTHLLALAFVRRTPAVR